VVELSGLGRDVPRFDIWGRLAQNCPAFDPSKLCDEDVDTGGDPTAGNLEPVSKASKRRMKRAAREWLAQQPPSVEGQGGDNYTFSVVCGVVKICYGFDSDEILKVLDEWNATCEPPWPAHQLRHKIAEAYKRVRPPLESNPLANFYHAAMLEGF
jgi:hypothetical protein